MIRIIVVLVALVAIPRDAAAQEPPAAVGGTINFVTQTHADDQPGGTTLGWSALVGVNVASRVSIEFEPSFGGTYSWEYTYRPSPSLTATVVASRRDTFFPVQARIKTGILEPVVGAAIVHGKIGRHAVIGTTTYFDDGRSENILGLVGGVDAAVKLAAGVSLVPTFRVLIAPRNADAPDPLGEQTSTGLITFRYGVGIRIGY